MNDTSESAITSTPRVGQTFANSDELKVAMDRYAKEAGFLFDYHNLGRKSKVRAACSNSRRGEPKQGGIEPKCGCRAVVRFTAYAKRDNISSGESVNDRQHKASDFQYEISSLNLEHTGGCEPSSHMRCDILRDREQQKKVTSSSNKKGQEYEIDPLSEVIRVPRGNFSRLLYTNPVCLLTSTYPNLETSKLQHGTIKSITTPNTIEDTPMSLESKDIHRRYNGMETTNESVSSLDSQEKSCPKRNVMTISWLTPTCNHGTIICSMNVKRFSASIIRNTGYFVLNVPVQGMEDLVRKIGGTTGQDGDKFESIETCEPGWGLSRTDSESNGKAWAGRKKRRKKQNYPQANSSFGHVAIAKCVAHMVCKVIHIQDYDPPRGVKGHILIQAQIEDAYVRKGYWSGVNFIPQDPALPPYLTFLGSQNFAYVRSS